jgi:hemolysin activation/secretion protein
MSLHRTVFCLAGALPILAATSANAAETQSPVDRADPGIVNEEMAAPEAQTHRQSRPTVAPAAGSVADFSGVEVTPGAIVVEGASSLSASDFAPAIEPYLGRTLGAAELRNLIRDLTKVARDAGFGLATAWIPQQRLSQGVLRVRLDEGRIDEIEGEGPAAALVEERLAPLTTGGPLRLAELERRLLIAGDLAGVTIGRARLERRGGRNVLIVPTSRDRVRGRASIDNSGSDTIGPVRARLAVDVNGLLAGDDRLTVSGAITPLQPREYQSVHAEYAVPVGGNGAEVAVGGGVGDTAAGGSLRDRDIAGTSTEIEARVTYPLLRGRDASVWATVGGAVRDSALDRAGTRVRDDRIVTTNVGLFANGRMAGGRMRVRLTYVQGFAWFGATVRGDPLASRADAGGGFTKLEFWLRYTRPLGSRFSVDLSAAGQLASRALLSTEEMGLGGRQFLRAFEYREMSGDRGAALSAELRYEPRLAVDGIDRLQLYAFADLGRVTNLRGGLGGGTLASAGGGARLWFLDDFDAAVELALPLTDGLFDTDPAPRVFFSLGSRF